MDILSSLQRLRWLPGTLGMRTTCHLPDGRSISIVKIKARYNFAGTDQYETLMSDSDNEYRHNTLEEIAEYIKVLSSIKSEEA